MSLSDESWTFSCGMGEDIRIYIYIYALLGQQLIYGGDDVALSSLRLNKVIESLS